MHQLEENFSESTLTTKSPISQILHGARDTFPLIVGAAPFGIIFGTLAATAGISFTATMAMSLFVFAGASQFVCVGMFAAGTAWPIIVLTTFVVNLRHLLYGATMVPYYKKLSTLWKIVLAFGLTDETFAVASSRYKDEDEIENTHYYNLGSIIFMHANWNFCTFLGLTAGTAFPGISKWGLDFAMVATFTGIVVPYLISRPMWAAVLTSGFVSLITSGLPHKLGLMIAALAGVAVGVLCEKIMVKKKELSK